MTTMEIKKELDKLYKQKQELKEKRVLTRKDIKQAIMVCFYGSKATPKRLFGEDTPELEAFYKMLEIIAPGAWELMGVIQGCWNPGVTEHSWVMADGFKAICPVLEMVDKRIETVSHGSFTHRAEIAMPSNYGVSLAANTVRSLESYICREMLRMAKADGFEMLTIFDSFWCSPNYMNQVRANYNHIMMKVHKERMMENILQQIVNDPNGTLDMKEDLRDEFQYAEYSLS